MVKSLLGYWNPTFELLIFINPDTFIFNFVQSEQKVFYDNNGKTKVIDIVVEFLKSYSLNWRDNQSNCKSIWLTLLEVSVSSHLDAEVLFVHLVLFSRDGGTVPRSWLGWWPIPKHQGVESLFWVGTVSLRLFLGFFPAVLKVLWLLPHNDPVLDLLGPGHGLLGELLLVFSPEIVCECGKHVGCDADSVGASAALATGYVILSDNSCQIGQQPSSLHRINTRLLLALCVTWYSTPYLIGYIIKTRRVVQNIHIDK